MEHTLNKRQQDLNKRIMRRIYFIWSIRTFLNPTFLKAAIVVVFFWRSTEYISYTQVFVNAPSILDIRNGLNFAQSALANTETVAFTLVLAAGILAIWVVADVLRPKQAEW